MASNGIPFLSKILALAGIGVKNQTDNKEVLLNVSASQPAGSTVSVDLPAASGTLAIKSEVVLASEKGVAGGVATLDGSGHVPSAQLPPYSISEVFVVADQAARLALVAQVGDVAVQTDTSTTYILQTEPPSVNSNWVVISATNAVTAVNGQAGPGPVTITAADVGAVAKAGDTMSGVLTMGPVSTGAGETGQIAFKELAANGAYSVTLRAPDALSDYVVLTLPPSHGSSGQVLTTNGSGVLDWATPAADSVTSVNGKVGVVVLNAADVGAVALTGDTMTGALIMGPTGTLSGQTGKLSLRELAANGAHSISLIAPDSIASDVTYVLPGSYGSAGQVLTDNGSGNLSWTTINVPVTSVNGQTGTVVLTTSDISEGTNLYFTDARAQTAITGGASSIATADLTASRALVSDASGKVSASSVTSTQLGYLSGVTSAIQTQIDGKVSKSGDTVSGILNLGPYSPVISAEFGVGFTPLNAINSSGGFSSNIFKIILKTTDGNAPRVKIGSNNLDLAQSYIELQNGSKYYASGVSGFADGIAAMTISGPQMNLILYSSTSGFFNFNMSFDGGWSLSINSSSISVSSGAQTGIYNASTAPYEIGFASQQTGPQVGGTLRFLETTGNGTNYVGFKAANSIAANVEWTLPSVDGSANQCLVTNGSGTLSWATFPADAVTSVNGKTGVVTLTTSDISEGTNLYFTDARAQAAITGGASSIATANLTASRALVSDASGKVAVSAATSTELGYLSGVSSAIQTQIDGKVSKSGDTMSGALVMGPIGVLPGEAGVIRLSELAANGSDTISLRAPDSLASSITLTLPANTGSAGQVLATNGSGTLAWVDATDSALSARVDKLEASRGVFTGNLNTGTVLDISALVPSGAVEYPIVQIYKVDGGANLQVNVEFSFNPTTKQITFGAVADGPISSVIHVLALTAPLTTL